MDTTNKKNHDNPKYGTPEFSDGIEKIIISLKWWQSLSNKEKIVFEKQYNPKNIGSIQEIYNIHKSI